MPIVELSHSAKADLKQIHSYIAEDSLDAADRLANEFSAKFRILADNPSAGRLRLDLGFSYRSFPYRRYVIFYVANEGGIEVRRVLHSAQDVESHFEM